MFIFEGITIHIPPAQILMFQSIMAQSNTELRELSISFFFSNNLPAALLCLDHYFTGPLRMHNLSVHELAEELRLFQLYTQLLFQLISHSTPAESVHISKLFGFQKLSENQILLPHETYLHAQRASRATPDSMDQDITLFNMEFHQFFRATVIERLRTQVVRENEVCRTCPAFTPCLIFAISGVCNRPVCPQAHVPGSSVNNSFYNARARVHLQQILILRTLHMLQYGLDIMGHRRYVTYYL